jgi:hypothetical protein
VKVKFWGKKKKLIAYQGEMANILVDLSGISDETARSFLDGNERFFEDCIDHELDAFGAVWRICNNSMDRLHSAHQTGNLSLVDDIPDFILLVSLRVAQIMMQNSPDQDETIRNNANFVSVCRTPIEPENPERTYFDLMQELANAHEEKLSDTSST